MQDGRKKALLRKREVMRQQQRKEKLKQEEKGRFLSAWSNAVEKAKTPTTSPRASPSVSPKRSQPPSKRGSRRGSRMMQTSGFGDRLTPGPPSPRSISDKLQPYAYPSRRRSSASSEQAYLSPRIDEEREKSEATRRKSETVPLYRSRFTQPVKYSVKPTAKMA